MKRFYIASLILLIGLLISKASSAQQSVLDPNDTVLNYPDHAPGLPAAAGIMAKWVRSPQMSWNTSPYKAYYYSTSSWGGVSFRLLFPKSYGTDPQKKYPMLIFFHGAGEISKNGYYDNELQLVNCGKKIMTEVENGDFDGFVIFPQTLTGYWPTYFSAVVGIINYMAQYNQLDKSRITVSGLSMGGQAVWDFIKSYPKLVAGAAPISAANVADEKLSVVDSVQSIPIWISQGGLDNDPKPAASEGLSSYLESHGVDVRYTLYPNKGHGVWDAHFSEPDAFSWMLKVNKTNPHVFSGRTEFCIGQPIKDTLSLTAGFEAYEWSKNGVVISGATSNMLIVSDTGTYAARYKDDGEWTYWSPSPVRITYKAYTQTPPITVAGLMSNVIPAPDGNNSVTLSLPPGYVSYQWRNATGQIVGTDSLYKASQSGNYIATAVAIAGCPAEPSDSFYVAANNGPNPPDPASALNGYVLSQTAIQLEWSNNASPVHNETAFEIYRGFQKGGPYELVGVVPADTLNYIDEDLTSNSNYFYVVRAVDKTGAAAVSNEWHGETLVDNQAPTAPDHLIVLGATTTSVTLSWTESADNVGVKNYAVYINGVRSYVTTNTTYTVPSLVHGESYTFTVKAFDVSGNISPASNQVVASAADKGLAYKFYTYTGSWSSLPTLTSLVPADSGWVNNITLDPASQTTYYAFSFDGYINIPQAGTYTFSTSSDDGSKLYINHTLVVNNDGLHSTLTKSQNYQFPQAGMYPFRVEYYNETGGAVLNVTWQRNSAPQFATSAIPDSAFIENVDLAGNPPSYPTNIIANALSYDSLKLAWIDNSVDETGFEIYRSTNAVGPYEIVYTAKADSVSFVDTTVLPSTTYYYKVQAINKYGSSGYATNQNKNFATTPSLPPAPTAPTELTATTISTDRIQLAWSNTSSNEQLFELYRSTNGGGQFRELTTLPAGSTSYVDSMLYGNTSYAYKIQASNVGGTSGFSNVANTTTFDNIPKISSNDQYYIPYGSMTSIVFAATDKDNESLALTAENLPSFASFNDNGDRTGTIRFSPSQDQEGNYQNIKLFVADQHGGIDSTTFNLTVNDVFAPVIQSVQPIEVNTYNLSIDTVYLANSDSVHNVIWHLDAIPYFIDTISTADGKLVLKIHPHGSDSGHYAFQVSAVNKYGSGDHKTLDLVVNYVSPRSWYLNFATNNGWQSYPGSPWNNIRGVSTTGLIDNLGNTGNVGLSLQSTSWATSNTGAQTGNNTGIYPDNVLRDFYYFGIWGSPNQVTGSVSGLDPDKKYNITFFSSSVWTNSARGHTVFQIGSKKDSVDVQSNTSRTVSFSNLAPNSLGVVSFTMSKGVDAGAGFLNAMIISEDTNMIAPSTPLSFQLKSRAMSLGSAVEVDWQPGSDNANGVQVYRSDTENGTYTLVNPEANNGTAVSYLDTTVLSGTTYYYYLAANNDYGSSAPSDTLAITTMEYVDQRVWYLNFATNNSWQSFPGSPWNNIRGLTTTGLIDNFGNSGNVGLSIKSTSWATSNTGAQTGNNSGIYPDNVLRDFYYFGIWGGPNVVTAVISGLDPGKRYNISFFSSSVWTNSARGHTVFQIGSRKDSIDVQSNTSRTIAFSNLSPDSLGSISFTMSKGSDAGAGFLNAMVISTDTNSVAPVKPLSLQLSSKAMSLGSAVQMNWQLGSDNANSIEIYRSTTKDGNYSLLNPGQKNGATTSYLDTAVTSATTYYYYLKAINNYGVSPSSDTEAITTSQYIDQRVWYVNFATNSTWQSFPGSPWNNVRGLTTNGLIDNFGNSGNVGISLQAPTWTTSNAGAQTGNNSGIYPDNVLRDFYYFGIWGSPNQVNGAVNGLDPQKEYSITFFSSSVWTNSTRGHTVFQIGTAKDSIDVQSNTSRTVTFSNLSPNSSGVIGFTLSKGSDAGAGFLNAMVITTQTLIPPSRPINIRAGNKFTDGENAVELNWQLGTDNTDSVFIYRSLNKYGSYELQQTWNSAMGGMTYLDTAVTPLKATTYYYYLIAANGYGRSSSTDTISITTLDMLPHTPLNLRVTPNVIDLKYVVDVEWDPSLDSASEIDVYRSIDRTGIYSLLGSVVTNEGLSKYTDVDVAQGGSYYYYLIGKNRYASSPTSDTAEINLPNTPPPAPPVISGVTDIYIPSSGIDTMQLSASSSGEPVNFELKNGPSFASLQVLGNNEGRIILTPSSSDVGEYDSLQVVATTSEGYADTAFFAVYVTQGSLLPKIYINFTSGGNTYGHSWNNILFSSGTNVKYNNLINSINKSTDVALTIVNPWSGMQLDGADTYNNSGFVPDSVMATGYFVSDTVTRTLILSGLNINRKYNLVFFGSSNAGGDSDYTTIYVVNADTVSLNGIRNTSHSVRINGLVPSQDGSLVISVSKKSDAFEGLINAVIVEEYAGNALVAPAGLTAAPREGKVLLSWDDRSDNEIRFDIFRSTILDGPYTLVGNADANSTSFEDDGVAANTRYFYKVVAVDDNGREMPSDVASATTPDYAVYVNFGLKEDPAPAPWNNTQAPPQEGAIYGPLMDSQGNNTGITLNMGNNFEGENPFGYSSGNNSGLYPDLVMLGTYYIDNGLDTVVMALSNLNMAMKYDLTFYGSVFGWGWQNTTQYIANGKMVSLETSYNTDNTVTLSDISPDANGQIIVKIIYTRPSRFAVLNAMVIQSHDDYDDQGNKVINPVLLMRVGNQGKLSLSKNIGPEQTSSTLQMAGTAYPNPFRDVINVRLSSPQTGKVALSLYGSNGKLVGSSISALAKGINSLRFEPATDLPSGIYVLSLRLVGTSQVVNIKLIRQ